MLSNVVVLSDAVMSSDVWIGLVDMIYNHIKFNEVPSFVDEICS